MLKLLSNNPKVCQELLEQAASNSKEQILIDSFSYEVHMNPEEFI